MRITLFHSHFTTLGGAEILLTTQARWLVAAGHSVRIVTFRASGALVGREMAGLRVEEIGFPSRTDRAELLTPGMMPDLVERSRSYLGDCDVVMAYNFPCAPITAAADSGARRVWYACEPFRALYQREANPFTTQQVESGGARSTLATAQLARRMRRRRIQHLLLPWTARAERELREFDRAGVAALDGVISLSRYGASCVSGATGRGDASVVYPMVRFADSAPKRQGIERDAPQLLVQTRLAIPKNLDTLMRAFVIVRQTHRRATLHVAGSGSGRPALEQIVRGEPGAVQFHGFLSRPDLDRLSDACDVFAFVPLDEPFGMVFPEAAARGLLMVGPDHGGPREILEDGAIGELCDPFDAESVAHAILRTLAMSDADADARRTAADASVRARFSPDAIGRSLETLLRG